MNYEKVSPTLAMALEDFEEGGRPALAEHNRTLGLVWVEDVPKAPRVVVFVHCDESMPADALAGIGVELNQSEGGVRTGIVRLDALDELTEHPAVQRVVPARRLTPLMDVAKEKVKVNAFRTASNLSGKGVIVGVVDTGIDTTNQSFKGRILRIWDQTLPGPGVPEGGYGLELKGKQIRTSQDRHGHGTHVAGIAASADPTFEGVAPKADLLIVNCDLMTAHIADAVRYVFRVAEDMGRPAVVNLSLGGHGDSHDGTDSLSLIIDDETGPGRIVCCAAGNEGNDNIHAQVQVKKGSTRTIATNIPRPQQAGVQPRTATFNGWYPGGDKLEVAVVPPAGGQTPYQPVITSGNPSKTYQTSYGVVRMITPGPDPANGDHNFFIQIQPAVNIPPTSKPHIWRIRVRGKTITKGGVLDLWVVDETVAEFTGIAVKDTMKIGSPGCAGSAVTVASYTTKVEWEDIFGNPHAAGLDVDDISDFSSEGPLRTGANKPDVTAPGAMIVSALAVHAPTPVPQMVDDSNRVMAGTSMACPFVSGVSALLLERDPQLDPAGVKELLRENSKIPRKRAGTFERKWGYGLIDASGL